MQPGFALPKDAAPAVPNEVIVAPLVSRHIDFLETLVENNSLGFDASVLKASLSRVILLLGSAPVGPTTIQRLLKYAGKLPTVRFGSTETTLQVCGIPVTHSESKIMAAFERGWAHVHHGEVMQYMIIRWTVL